MSRSFLRALPLLLVLLAAAGRVAAQVSVREEKLAIPTWEIGPPALHSLFGTPRGIIYPYTLNETLTDRKTDREYSAVILENEYIRVLVLPEIGGRLHGAEDKTNGYAWLYWQRTIKPGLISPASSAERPPTTRSPGASTSSLTFLPLPVLAFLSSRRGYSSS
jgi:hypothetical protein